MVEAAHHHKQPTLTGSSLSLQSAVLASASFSTSDPTKWVWMQVIFHPKGTTEEEQSKNCCSAGADRLVQ